MAGTALTVPADGWRHEGVLLGETGLLEWSVLDARWFALAQRRRLFALLDTGEWARRPPVLLEPDHLRAGLLRRAANKGQALPPLLHAALTAGPTANPT